MLSVLEIANEITRVEWLDWDSTLQTGKIVSLPTREQISENIKEQLIVELYSK